MELPTWKKSKCKMQNSKGIIRPQCEKGGSALARWGIVNKIINAIVEKIKNIGSGKMPIFSKAVAKN